MTHEHVAHDLLKKSQNSIVTEMTFDIEKRRYPKKFKKFISIEVIFDCNIYYLRMSEGALCSLFTYITGGY